MKEERMFLQVMRTQHLTSAHLLFRKPHSIDKENVASTETKPLGSNFTPQSFAKVRRKSFELAPKRACLEMSVDQQNNSEEDTERSWRPESTDQELSEIFDSESARSRVMINPVSLSLLKKKDRSSSGCSESSPAALRAMTPPRGAAKPRAQRPGGVYYYRYG
jgi:hypothetical protein